MTSIIFGRLLGYAAVTAMTSSSLSSPALAQSDNAKCFRSAVAVCSVSIEGYSSYAECVAEERRQCLEMLPEPPPSDGECFIGVGCYDTSSTKLWDTYSKVSTVTLA